MKNTFARISVLMVLVGASMVVSGCEGLNPAADFMKIQAEEMQSKRETEAELQMQENQIAADLEMQKEQNRHDEQMAANEQAAATRDEQAGNDPASNEVITPGTTLEGSADVDNDESSVDNSISNEETNENLGD